MIFVQAGGAELIISKHQIIKEAKDEFEQIMESNLTEDEKLNELVKLRNYLKETYILSGFYDEYQSLVNDLESLISDIDSCWWDIFTKGGNSK